MLIFAKGFNMHDKPYYN